MKKIVGVITLLCMSASMLNMHAGSFALTDMTNFGTLLGGDNSSPFNIQGIMGGVVESGLCGDDLSWYFSTDKVLIITGNGDMNNYTAGTAPWYEYASEIKEIELSDDITFIGNYAFYNCTQITEINIPDTVTEIGYDAFKNCSGIENIEIPDTVTIIGTSAFEGCSNLQEITLPQNLSKIYTYTFALCKKLKNIIIPDEVTIIESGAFTNCTAILEIYIPENITEIGKNVFYGCESLETVIYGGNEEQWNNINVKTGNSLLEDIDVQYLKNEEKTEYVFCGKLLEDDSVIYDENDNAICEECLWINVNKVDRKK